MKQLGLAPAVAGPETDTIPETHSPDELVGIWTSDIRETKHGPMKFQFRIESDRTIDVLGTPVNGSKAEVFRRNGSYQMDGDQLVSPAINLGQPVQVYLRGGRLIVKFDETLVFELRRG